jgi:hypothetical protein
MQYVLKFTKDDAVFATSQDAANDFNQGIIQTQAQDADAVVESYNVSVQESWDQDTKILTITQTFAAGATNETAQNYITDLSNAVPATNSNGWYGISFEIVD